ncbi:MAG TPA: hypothetical protein VK858_21230 [Longimicrobiales bacterium]|nr:hypothetical protein [Longimicrobiales bacterium]
MTVYLCTTCGATYPPAASEPRSCPICLDARQYVPPGGQRWTTRGRLGEAHRNRVEKLAPGLHAIEVEPCFAIGQRALLVQDAGGNVLWDCVPLLDDEAFQAVDALGGISDVAISHPHYYGGMIEWARAFDATIHLHAADRRWVTTPDARVRFWEGETLALSRGCTLHRLGGHFDGGQVLHWAPALEGKGILLSGDVVQVVPDRRWVSFMYSYPNLIPLAGPAVKRIGARLADLDFERIYGAFPGREVLEDGNGVVERSVARYLSALERVPDDSGPLG